jgi:hypothetical protein
MKFFIFLSFILCLVQAKQLPEQFQRDRKASSHPSPVKAMFRGSTFSEVHSLATSTGWFYEKAYYDKSCGGKRSAQSGYRTNTCIPLSDSTSMIISCNNSKSFLSFLSLIIYSFFPSRFLILLDAAYGGDECK